MANYNVNLTFTADTKAAKAQLQSLKSDLQALSSGANLDARTETMSKQLNEASQAARELKAHLEAATNVQTGNLDFTKLSKSLKDSGKTLSDYGQQLKVLGATGDQAFVQLTRAVMNAEVPLRKTSDLVDKMLVTFKNNARWMASSAVLNGITQSLSSAYSYAQNLNRSLSDIRIVTGYNIDKMKEFAVQANKAAKALSTSTTSYTNASLIYFQQGLSDKEVKERANVTVKLANVTGESTEAISEQLTAVWNNFYDGSKSLEYYADVMTKLGAATASSSEEISQGLEKFAAVADTVGLSYEYAASALATVTATTRESADVVGTAFKTLFSRIQGLNLGETQDDGTTLNKYSQALASVGVSVKDAAGNLRDMDDILNSLGSKWDTLAKTQQVALAQTIGGARQYSNFIALMDNWDYFQENLTTAMGSTGALQEQADIYAESWEAAQMRVKASAQAIYSDLIDDEFFIKLLNGVDKVLEGVDKLIGSLGGLKGILSSISVIVLSLGKNSLVKTLDTAIYNVGMLTESGRKRVLEDKNRQTADAISQLKVADSGDVEETERLKGNFMHEAELQNAAQVASATASDSALMIIKSNLETVQQLSQQAQEAVKASRENRTATEEYLRKLVGIRKEVPVGKREEVNKHISAYASALQQSNVLYSDGSHAWTTLQDYKDDQKKRLQVFDEMALGSGLEAKDKEQLRKALETSYEQFEVKLAELDAQAIKNLQQKHQQIVDDLNEYHKKDKAENKAEDLNEFESNNTNAAADMDVVRVQAAYQKAVDGTAESIKNAAVHQKEWSEIIVETASVVTSATSTINALKGIGDAIKDDDLSGWEKFTSILTSLTFALPMMLNGFKSLRNLLQKETLARIANTAAAKAEADAVRASNIEKGIGTAKDKVGNVASGVGKGVVSVFTTNPKNTFQNAKNGIKNWWSSAVSPTWNENAWKGLSKEAQEEYLKQFTTTNTTSITPEQLWGSLTKEQQDKYKSGALTKTEWSKLNNKFVGTKKGIKPTNVAKEYGDYRTKFGQEAAAKELGTETVETVVDEAGAKSAAGKSAAKGLVTKAGGAALIAAGVAVAVLAVKGLKAAYDKANTAAAEAAEYANSLANAYQNVKTAYTDLKNTAESWTEKDTALDSLQVGTTEWKEALIEANEEALKLIDTYDNLKYEVDSTGRIKIDKDSLETVQDQELKKVEKAQGNAALAKANALEAEIEADRKNFNRKYSSADTADAVGQFAGYGAAGGATGAVSGALVGAGIGLFLGPAGAAIGAVIGSAIGSAVGAISGEVVAANTGQESAKEQAIVENLVDKYMAQNDGNAWMETSEDFAQAAKELGLTTEDEIDALKDLVKETAANTEQLKLQNGIAGAQKGEEYIEKYGTVAEKAAWNKLTEAEKQVVGGNLLDSEELKDRVYELTHVGGEYDEGASTFWHPFKTKTDKEVHEQYAQDVLGWDVDDANIIYENKNGKGYFKNSDTGEEYELDDTEMRQALAYNQAYNELFGKNITADALKGISDLRIAGYDAAIAAGLDKSSTSAVGNALTAGKEDLAKEVATLSAEERDVLIDLYNDPTALKDIDYTGSGYSSLGEYLADLEKAINAWDEESAAKAVAKRRQEEYETALSSGVATLDIAEEALSYYTDALARNNKYLTEGTTAAIEYATAQAKLRQNFSALSDTIGENISILSTGNKDSLAYSVALGEVANSIGELFGVTPDTSFVGEYLDDIIDFVNTGKGGEELRKAISENWLVNNEDIEDDVKDALREAAQAADEMGLSAGQSKTITSEEAFNKDGLEAMLADGTLTAETLQAYMNARGLEVALDKNEKTIVSISKAVDEEDFVATAKELIDALDDISARYYQIERQIKNIQRAQSRLNTVSQNYFGQAKVEAYEKEIELLNELSEAEEAYAAEAEVNVQKDRDELLAAYGDKIKLDATTGEVVNYQEIYDSLSGEEQRKSFEEAVNRYTNSLDSWRDAVDAAVEYEQEAISKKWEKLNYSIDLEIEFNSDDQKYLDLLISLGDDPLKDAASNIENYTKKVGLLADEVSSYGEAVGEILGIDASEITFANSVGIIEAISEKLASGDVSLDENQIAVLEGYRDKLYEIIEVAQQYPDTIKDYIVSALEAANEEFDKSSSKLEHYNKILTSYQNIVGLVGKDKLGLSDEAYIEMLQTQQNVANAQVAVNRETYETNKANLDALKAEFEAHGDEWTDEMKEAWKESIEEAEQLVYESEEALQESWEAALESAAQVFESTVNTVVSSFEKSMTGVYGTFEKLQEAYDQQSTLNSRYVADYEKIYNLSKLNRNIQKSIDDTSNSKAKKSLLSLQQQINELNESDAEVSQYQLDYLQKQYDLKLAMITLEEAQNAKSTVRMRRDAEGNYSYVFTANAEEISSAEQSVEDALYSAQKLTQDYIETNQAAIIQIQNEYVQALKNIRAEDYASEAEYRAALDETTAYYQNMLSYYTSELDLALDDASTLYENDWQNYSAATGYKISSNKDWIDDFDKTFLPNLSQRYGSATDLAKGWKKNVKDINSKVIEAYNNYAIDVGTAFDNAGTPIGTFASNYDNKATEINGITSSITSELGSISSAAKSAFEGLVQYAADNSTLFSKQIGVYIEKATKLINTLNELKKVSSEASAENQDEGEGEENTYSISGWGSADREGNREAITQEFTEAELQDILSNGLQYRNNGSIYYKDNVLDAASVKAAAEQGGYSKTYAANFDNHIKNTKTTADSNDTSGKEITIPAMSEDDFKDYLVANFSDIHDKMPEILEYLNTNFGIKGQDEQYKWLNSAISLKSSKIDGWVSSLPYTKMEDTWIYDPNSTGRGRTLKRYVNAMGVLLRDGDVTTTFYGHKYKLTDRVRSFGTDYIKLDGVDGWFKESDFDQVSAFRTGGYTGDWTNSEGRLALLHQKEIVLNQDDTANLLSTVDMVRNIARVIDLNAASSANALGTLTASLGSTGAQTIEQKVEITASFPNATNHSEIEQAFTTLINEATQFANRKKL